MSTSGRSQGMRNSARGGDLSVASSLLNCELLLSSSALVSCEHRLPRSLRFRANTLQHQQHVPHKVLPPDMNFFDCTFCWLPQAVLPISAHCSPRPKPPKAPVPARPCERCTTPFAHPRNLEFAILCLAGPLPIASEILVSLAGVRLVIL